MPEGRAGYPIYLQPPEPRRRIRQRGSLLQSGQGRSCPSFMTLTFIARQPASSQSSAVETKIKKQGGALAEALPQAGLIAGRIGIIATCGCVIIAAIRSSRCCTDGGANTQSYARVIEAATIHAAMIEAATIDASDTVTARVKSGCMEAACAIATYTEAACPEAASAERRSVGRDTGNANKCSRSNGNDGSIRHSSRRHGSRGHGISFLS